jgi:hypothetical protein
MWHSEREHAKPVNFGLPNIDLALLHYFIAASREGVLPEAVKALVDARKVEVSDG